MRRHPVLIHLLRLGINALGILVATWLIPGIECHDTTALLIVVLVLGVFNTFLKPLLVLWALPFVVLTLGFGILLINAFLFMGAASLVPGFEVAGFGSAFFGAVVISLVNLFLGGFVGDTPGGIRVRRFGPPGNGHGQPGPKPRDPFPRHPTPRPDDPDVIDI